jgi:hypothetical protein
MNETNSPSNSPTVITFTPSLRPSNSPTVITFTPSLRPSISPSAIPTHSPTLTPSHAPTHNNMTFAPSHSPTHNTFAPSTTPSLRPSHSPTTLLAPSPHPTTHTYAPITHSPTVGRDEDESILVWLIVAQFILSILVTIHYTIRIRRRRRSELEENQRLIELRNWDTAIQQRASERHVIGRTQ